MKKMFVFALALAAAIGASAQSASDTASGRISIGASTYAGATGIGQSISHADSSAVAATALATSTAPNTATVAGAVSGQVFSTAYNVSSGSGFGSASAGGWSDASVAGQALVSSPTGGVAQGNLSVDGGMTNAVLNGVDSHVVAGTSQDGFANGTYAGTGSVTATNGANGSVVGSTSADGQVAVGAVTFSGGVPAGQSAAYREANTGVVTSVTGNFNDGIVSVTP